MNTSTSVALEFFINLLDQLVGVLKIELIMNGKNLMGFPITIRNYNGIPQKLNVCNYYYFPPFFLSLIFLGLSQQS
jgi:hypothetical protein